jgi:hypothetical protein
LRTLHVKNRRTFLTEGLVAAVGLGTVIAGCGGSGSADADAPGADAGEGGGMDAGPEAGPEAGLDASPGLDAQPDVVQDAAPDAATPGPRPTTTARERIQGVLPSEKQSSSEKPLWGVTETVPGDLHVRLDALDVDSIADVPTGPAASIFYMAQMSDVHIIDEESPARTINLDQITSPSWRKQEAYSTQVLDAMVRKLHQFDACRKLDCVVVTGDCIDNNQKNELAWFLRVMEGGQVTPNSGDLEDPWPGPDNDPHDAFEAHGMANIPWFMVAGNHDVLIQGNLSHGLILDYSGITGDPTRGSIGTIAMGRVNPPTCNDVPSDESPTPERCIPTDPGDLDPGDLPSDGDRSHLSREAWYEMVLAAGGLPAGHGFKNYAASTGIGDYVAEPTPGVPVRLVVLDTSSAVGAQGNYDRIGNFLEPALEQALAADMAVIVISHHYSSGVLLQGQQLRETLARFPNVLLHLCGHGHENIVTEVQGESPEYGYWEVQTCGLVSWPQQARLVEVVDNRNGTADLWLTLIDFEVDHQPAGPLAEASRFLALYEIHNGKEGGGMEAEGDVHDRNVILPVSIPPGVRAKFAQINGKEPESPLFA